MPFEESKFNTWEFNLITNRHKISGQKFIPPQTKTKTRPKDSLSLSTQHVTQTGIPAYKPPSENAHAWRDFNIVSNDYYNNDGRKKKIDRVYEYRSSMNKLWNTNPFNPVMQKWKQPQKEQSIKDNEAADVNGRVNVWNKNKNNNFIHHRILQKSKSSNIGKLNRYDSAKHPEVYHRIESLKKIKPKNRIHSQVYRGRLKRNHHIITNQPWKGTNSIEFPLGNLKLKHPKLWK